MLVVAFAIHVLPIYSLKQQLDTYAAELVREAEIAGCVGVETSHYAEELNRRMGFVPEVHWSQTGRIQLNGEVSVTVTLQRDVGLFGGLGSFPIPLTGKASGKGQVYWK